MDVQASREADMKKLLVIVSILFCLMNTTLVAAAGPAQTVLESELNALKARRQSLEAELRQLEEKIGTLEKKMDGSRNGGRSRTSQPQIM
jgi:peptidoglycan hydrolase CwlO-like protein